MNRFAGLLAGLLIWAGLVLPLPAAVPGPADPREGAPVFQTAVDRETGLVAAMVARIELMPQVAAWKHRRGQPVLDPVREAAVLRVWRAEAEALGLAPDPMEEFLRLQIAWARRRQEGLVAEWRVVGVLPAEPPDLNAVLRPRLDEVGRELLAAAFLAAGEALPAAADPWARLAGLAGLAPAELRELKAARSALRRTGTATLAGLRRVGILRVGTTGDYAPFSSDAGGVLRGLDIELARDLSGALGLQPVFVPTSWPGLMADLRAHRFDLAVSGITVTAERAREAAFSVAYLEDGKTAIARQVDAPRFGSLAAIDRPGVRVIVNPGGTNERFVREHLRRAEIVLHPDNRTIFAALAEGAADVMFTDGIEVRLQSRRDPRLGGSLAEPLTRAGKAMLLPRDAEWRGAVDAWLGPLVTSGAVAERLERALAEASGEKRL
ncbi:MAG: transporter substrate-binding domain-containing protein [Verrucomicrobia bacterium]|nr:transporter substrate-binding domain-containing protein [Verrucomicrobiota bacterium]